VTVDEESDDELRGLFESEGRAPAPPADVRGRVASRLASTLATAPAGGRPLRAGSWGAPHVAAVVSAFAIGVTAGVFGSLALRPRPSPLAHDAAPSSFAPEAFAPFVTPSAPLSSAAPLLAPLPLAPHSSSASPTPLSAERPLRAEQALLDSARVALGRGDGAAALDAATVHARRFPHGELSEERDAIAVQALVLLGRGDEARARAERFRRAYPESALFPAIREALGSSP
jgi:hypothetical protein